MTYNLMEEYINFTKKFLRDFMREYFKEEYSRQITDSFIEAYIDARYYNYGGNERQKVFYRRIYSALKKQSDILIADASNDKEIKAIKDMLEFYQYIFYIDFVRELKIELKLFVDQLNEKRKLKFELKEETGLKEKLLSMIKEFQERKKIFLTKFESNEFELIIKKFPLVKNVYNVGLNYNFKIPYLFSDKAIEEVYTENVINEDKIIIEYLMLTVFNINAVLTGNFTTQYLVDFPETLFAKEKKLEQVLRIIDSQAILDKVNLKITFKNFVEYKENIYDLMQKGYRFAVILDDTFVVTKEEIRKLLMFKYVILNTKLDKYEDIYQYSEEIENLLIDEG